MNASNDMSARSSFITSTAWTFIVFAGLSSAIALLQNIVVGVMFPAEGIRLTMREAQGQQAIPGFMVFMFEHLQFILGALLALSLFTLVSAIGLLKRRNWARLVFIGMMVLGVVGNVAGILLPYAMFAAFPPMPDTAASDSGVNFELMINIMSGVMAVVAIVFAVLFGWIAKRLMSTEIKREFNAL